MVHCVAGRNVPDCMDQGHWPCFVFYSESTTVTKAVLLILSWMNLTGKGLGFKWMWDKYAFLIKLVVFSLCPKFFSVYHILHWITTVKLFWISYSEQHTKHYVENQLKFRPYVPHQIEPEAQTYTSLFLFNTSCASFPCSLGGHSLSRGLLSIFCVYTFAQ